MLRTIKITCLCCTLLLGSAGLFAQQTLKIQIVSDNEQFLPADIMRSAKFTSYKDRFLWLESFRSEMLNRGHLAFSIDSIIESNEIWNVHTHVGQKFEWASLSPGNLDGATLG